MSFFNTISKNDVVFLTPLIVATAPLSLPYILLCKTQGRSVKSILIPKLKRHFQSSPPAVSRSITGCFAQQNIGEVSEGRRG